MLWYNLNKFWRGISKCKTRSFSNFSMFQPSIRSGYIWARHHWKQITNHIFFPKDTLLESEKIEGIWGGNRCGVRMPQSVSPSRAVKKYHLSRLANTTNLSFSFLLSSKFYRGETCADVDSWSLKPRKLLTKHPRDPYIKQYPKMVLF